MTIGSSYTISGSYGIAGSAETVESKKAKGEVINYNLERKVGGTGTAELIVGDSYTVLASDENTAIGLSNGCIIFKGRIHLASSPEAIRVNGFWELNPELQTTNPSTIFNPVQTLLYKPPAYAKKAASFFKLVTSIA